MKKVLVVFGTRPEAIKMCPLVLELRKHTGIKCKVCVTAQHREMLDSVMAIFDVVADYDLNIMQDKQSLAVITEKVISELDNVLDIEEPDIVLVHGDTTTSFVSALASFYRNIPVGHVEAGLRTGNIKSPFPEEFNRVAVDKISSIFFAPTSWACDNLLNEGQDKKNIFITGNTVIDAMQYTVDENFSDSNLKWASDSRVLLLTTHRRENIGLPMINIFKAILRIIEDFSDVKIIFPVHKNPKVREIAERMFREIDRIRMIEPLNVIQFHNYMSRSYFVLSDSGGVQEEAPSLGKPVLVLRDVTERPEGVEAGTLRLVGTDEESVYSNARELLVDKRLYETMSKMQNPYGDGHACERISRAIEGFL